VGLTLTKSLLRPHVPWYTLSLRHLRLRVVLPAVLIGLGLVTVSEKHCWQWAWSSGPFAQRNCQAVDDDGGRKVQAWRWAESGLIHIWTPANFPSDRTARVRDAVRSLVNEVGVPVTVSVQRASPRVIEALAQATSYRDGRASVDFDRLCRLLVTTREHPSADFIVAPVCVDGDTETAGAAYFTYGVALLDAEIDGPIYARHETAHLLGYGLHDTWPVAVVGYAALRGDAHGGGSLMMPTPAGEHLSDRAHDALTAFWGALPARLRSP
jgi:hypothetical protein